MGVSVHNFNLQQRIQPAAIKMTSIYRNTAAMARENGGEGKTSKAGAPQRKALETKYLVELALPEYTLAHIPPSLLASAALYLSLMIQEPGSSLTSVWSPTLQYYSTYRPEDVLPVVSSLAAVLARAGETKLRAVHTKYSSRKFYKVAERSELTGEMVGKLARMRPTQL